jgi:glycosyltransferase involved in cell wall biosynthesis
MHMPLTFSIITCTWNSAQFLDEAIASILAQDYPYVEIIFVDGGSTDSTLEKIRALHRPYKLIENIKGGVSRAMNEGIRHATGDVIAHLHSDDYYLSPYVLSKVAEHFETSGRSWLFGRIKQNKSGVLHGENFTAPTYSYAQLLNRNYIPHPATFVRRELMLQSQGFDPKLKYAMDYDLWLKIAQHEEPVQLKEALAAFRVHDGSLSSSNVLAALKEDYAVRIRHANAQPISRVMHYLRYLVRRHRAIQAGAQA